MDGLIQDRHKRRLLFVVNVGWFFLSHRLPVALAAQARGYQVHLATALDPELDRETEKILADHGIVLHKLQLSRSGSHPLELFRALAKLTWLLKRLQPTVVHLVTLKPLLIGGLAARLARVPSVVFAVPGRGSVFSARGALATLRRWGVLMLYRLAYNDQCNRVIVQNVEDQDYFASRGVFPRANIRLIRGSGVDLQRFVPQPEPSGEMVVVLASRMLKEKGVAHFVAAARMLRARAISARFVLVGDPDHGNPHSHTAGELRSWQDSGAIEWWGFRADMSAVFAACHVVCLPTYYGEGIPKVLIEAAACGRAIITTNTPGCSDIVQDGCNGLLVPPRDARALADAIDALIHNPERRLAMGACSRRWVEQFGLHVVTSQTLDVYEELAI